MLENLFVQKACQIREQAVNDMNVAFFIVNLIDIEWSKYSKVFNPTGSVSKDLLPEHVYSSVEKTLQNLEGSSSGRIVRCKDKTNPPVAVQLGWAELQASPSEEDSKLSIYNFKLTDLGTRVIKSYRHVRGLEPICSSVST